VPEPITWALVIFGCSALAIRVVSACLPHLRAVIADGALANWRSVGSRLPCDQERNDV
jgi:hypothetical protein